MLFKNLLVAIFFTSLHATAEPESTYTYGFGDVLPRSEVAEFVQSSGASPKKVHMWLGGFSGTYQNDDELSAEYFLQQAVSESARFYQSALEMNKERINRLLDGQSKEDFASDEKVVEFARNLLSYNRRFTAMVSAIESNQPMIYGIELDGDSTALETAAQNSRVQSYLSTGNISSLRESILRANPILPDHLEVTSGLDAFSANIDPNELFDEIVAATEQQ